MRALLSLLLIAPATGWGQGVICDPSANLLIYSNYDGGRLLINIDEDIPDLRLGLLSYEYSIVEVMGPYAGNVTQVLFAGYNATNDHCNLGTGGENTVIGAPNAVIDILQFPPATVANPYGYGYMICCYNCSTDTYQGGCNTADQVEAFFLATLGGSLRHHWTQYACWEGMISVSQGGTCCTGDIVTSIAEEDQNAGVRLFPNPVEDLLRLEVPGAVERVQVFDALGRDTGVGGAVNDSPMLMDVRTLVPGSYLLRVDHGERNSWHRFQVER